MTLLLAGHETTANALSWTLMLLSQHPKSEAKLLQELHSVLGDRPPTVTDLNQLPYLQTVIKESMQLYPPVWALSREVVRECQIGGYRLPPGTLVYVSPWVMHRDSRFFEAPDQFRPERWADHLEQSSPPGAYLPFGDGPRVCIVDTPQPKGVGILASTGESRKHETKSRYFPRSQNRSASFFRDSPSLLRTN